MLTRGEAFILPTSRHPVNRGTSALLVEADVPRGIRNLRAYRHTPYRDFSQTWNGCSEWIVVCVASLDALS